MEVNFGIHCKMHESRCFVFFLWWVTVVRRNFHLYVIDFMTKHVNTNIVIKENISISPFLHQISNVSCLLIQIDGFSPHISNICTALIYKCYYLFTNKTDRMAERNVFHFQFSCCMSLQMYFWLLNLMEKNINVSMSFLFTTYKMSTTIFNSSLQFCRNMTLKFMFASNKNPFKINFWYHLRRIDSKGKKNSLFWITISNNREMWWTILVFNLVRNWF